MGMVAMEETEAFQPFPPASFRKATILSHDRDNGNGLPCLGG
jgi:hypothetical protein